MVLRAWLSQAEERLANAGVEFPRLNAEQLAGHALGAYRAWVLAHPDAEIDESVAEGFLQRREAREPLAYILGWREFYGRRFKVGPGVLIPRQETEGLIAAALDGTSPARVLDLGTGSGCIGITLKLERPEWTIFASDVSADALRIASENARELEAEVFFLAMDGFGAMTRESGFDLIICNPPYIAYTERLMPEVAAFEPETALRAGSNGLAFYERLSMEAKENLSKRGGLLVEMGWGQAGAIQDIFAAAGWRPIFVRRDLAGIERVAYFIPN